MPTRRFRAALALIILTVVTAPLGAQAPAASAGYQVPPKVIVDILDAAPTPSLVLASDGHLIALLERKSMPALATTTASVAVVSPR